MHASTHACTPAPDTHACTHSLTRLWCPSYTRCAPYLLISLRTHAIALSIIYANFLRTHTIIASITTHVMCIVDTTIIVYDTHKRSAPYWFISSREFVGLTFHRKYMPGSCQWLRHRFASKTRWVRPLHRTPIHLPHPPLSDPFSSHPRCFSTSGPFSLPPFLALALLLSLLFPPPAKRPATSTKHHKHQKQKD